jgi:hypothetical protein
MGHPSKATPSRRALGVEARMLEQSWLSQVNPHMNQHYYFARAIIAYLIGFTAVLLCVSRTVWRRALYLRHIKGVDTKNVLIVGPNHLGNVVRKQIAQQVHLGRCFKGFLQTAHGESYSNGGGSPESTSIDEIIVAEPCTHSSNRDCP